MSMNLGIEIRPQIDKGFYAELAVANSTPIRITVVGIGLTVGDALADLGRQLGDALDWQVD